MTHDWDIICSYASSFKIEIHNKEIWLVKYDGPIIDGFRPQILCAKSDLKDKDLVSKFSEIADRQVTGEAYKCF